MPETDHINVRWGKG